MRYRKPEELKESGINWIGSIPLDWQLVKLNLLADYINGNAFKPEEHEDEGLPIIRINQLTSEDASFDYYSGKLDKKYKVKNGDLLFSWSATLDAFIWNGDEAWLNQHIFNVKPYGEVIKEFLYYGIKASIPAMVEISHGSTMKHIKKSALNSTKLPVPSKPEQRSISTFLDRKTEAIDALIQKKEQLIERLKEKRQALITRAVTKGLDPNVPMKDSGIEWLGKIPEEWELIKFKHVVNLVTESVEDSDFSIALENIESWTGDYIETDSNYTASGTLFREGDVLFGKLRPYLAKVYLANQKGKAIGDIYIFRSKKVIPKYLFMIVDSKAFIDIVNSSTYGAKMPRASWDFIGELKIPIPDVEKQREIVRSVESSLSSSENIIDKIDEEIQLLTEYRQSLISAAVTGKIDVRATEVHKKTKEPRKEISSWDKFVLAMEIIKRMQENQHFGRIMLVKILFLIEYHLRIKGFNSNYKRWDHGPFDNQLINSVEYNLKKDGWINIELEESKNYDQKVYTPTKKAYEKSHYFKNSWGDLDDEIEQILNIFNDANSTQAEIIATVYAAYNDLLIEGKEPSEDEVLDEILNNWHPDKKKISEERWRSAYRWIKEKELVPTGFGKSTKEVA